MFSLAPILVITGNFKIIDAFRKSWEICKRYWKWYAKRLILAGAYYVLIALAVALGLMYVLASVFDDFQVLYTDPFNSWPAIILALVSIFLIPCFSFLKLILLREINIFEKKRLEKAQ